VGGSIAGCAAAVALSQVGCAVTVFERARGTLADRGVGIGMAPQVQATLAVRGLIDPAMPYCARRSIAS
jgi:2-polyprenyl-6-methoxyphenol hydroxylase-like FAD-dependent oxidoreductase